MDGLEFQGTSCSSADAQDINIFPIIREEIDDVWYSISAYVDMSFGVDKSYSNDDVRNFCKGEGQLWIVYKSGSATGFLVSSLIDAPQGKICYGAWLGGENIESWVNNLFSVMEAYAKENNCLAYSFIGRKAWKRLTGFDYSGVYYYKNI